VGQTTRLPLIGALGSGNTWQAEVTGEAIRVTVEFTSAGRAEAARGGPPPATSVASETLVVTAVRAGRARIRLRLGRAWQPDSPLAQHELEVTVTERDGGTA